jgi:uncharacterized protein (DUF1330 family)
MAAAAAAAQQHGYHLGLVRIDGGPGSAGFAEHWPRYEALASPMIAASGTILAADDAPVVLEGTIGSLAPLPRVVLGQYRSVPDAAALFTSAEYENAAVHRRAASSSDIIVAGGQPVAAAAAANDRKPAGRLQSKGYHIIILELLSEELYAEHWPEYERLAGPAVEQFGGNVLVVEPAATAIETSAGIWREGARCVVVEYETVGQALAMYESEQYQTAAVVRRQASTCIGFLLVEGLPPPAQPLPPLGTMGWRNPKYPSADHPEVAALRAELDATAGIPGLEVVDIAGGKDEAAVARAAQLFHRDGFVCLGPDLLDAARLAKVRAGCERCARKMLDSDPLRLGDRGTHR